MSSVRVVVCPECRHIFRPQPATPSETTHVATIRNVAVILATPDQENGGLLAWAGLAVGPFSFDGLAIRRRLDGEVIVTYPARKDGRGGVHPAITTLDPELDRRIKAAVIAAYVAERAKCGRSAS